MRDAPDKNPFRGVSDLLSRAAPATRSAHFLAYMLDLLLVAITSYLLFLGGYSVVTSTDAYKENNALYQAEVTYYQDMVVDAHLAVYLDRDINYLAEGEDLAIKMAISQILLSYHSGGSSEFEGDPLPKLQSIYVGSFYQDAFTDINFSNDYISRFFIDYVPTHNPNNELVDFKGKTPQKYVVDFYRSYAKDFDNIKFVYPAEDDEPSIPYLRPSIANSIYEYLVREDGFSRDAYDSFVNFYVNMLKDSETMVFKANSYQTGRYQDYLFYRHNITVAVATTLLVAIIVGYYLAIFLPQMIFKDGRSLGRIVLRQGVINTDKSEVELWKYIVRSIFAACSYLYIAFFLVLLPPFNGASSILYLPYIIIGALDITLINIVIGVFILASINGIFMLLTHEKRNAFDLMFNTLTVDVTMLDEPDYDERDEANI